MVGLIEDLLQTFTRFGLACLRVRQLAASPKQWHERDRPRPAMVQIFASTGR
jgi:hypothetical protein